MKKQFFFRGTNRFPFLNSPISNWEEVTNDQITVFDGRIKVNSVGELLAQDVSIEIRREISLLPPSTRVLVNYIEKITAPIPGPEGGQIMGFIKKIPGIKNLFGQTSLVEMNDRKFHGQYFDYMYQTGLEQLAQRIYHQDLWQLDEITRLTHYTFFYQMSVAGKPLPFDPSVGFRTVYDGLPQEFGEGKLLVIVPAS